MCKKISVLQAKNILNENIDSVLVDIRDYDSYNLSHALKAIHLNENLSEFIDNTPKDVPILVMCYHGNSSQVAAQFLYEYGFSNVYSIDGGYEAWIENGQNE